MQQLRFGLEASELSNIVGLADKDMKGARVQSPAIWTGISGCRLTVWHLVWDQDFGCSTHFTPTNYYKVLYSADWRNFINSR